MIDDPEAVQQTLFARQFLKTVRPVYVPQIVQVECVWVLERAYKVPKNKLLGLLTTLSESRVFSMVDQYRVVPISTCWSPNLQIWTIAKSKDLDSILTFKFTDGIKHSIITNPL